MSGSIYNSTPIAMSRRAGLVTLEIDGEAMDVAGDLAYDATLYKREPLEGQSGPQGYSEMLKYGFISASIRDAGTLSQQRMMEKVNVSVTAVTATGKTVYGASLTCMECSEVKTAEGTFDVKFVGFVTEGSY